MAVRHFRKTRPPFIQGNVGEIQEAPAAPDKIDKGRGDNIERRDRLAHPGAAMRNQGRAKSRDRVSPLRHHFEAQGNTAPVHPVVLPHTDVYRPDRKGRILTQVIFASPDQQRQPVTDGKIVGNRGSGTAIRNLRIIAKHGNPKSDFVLEFFEFQTIGTAAIRCKNASEHAFAAHYHMPARRLTGQVDIASRALSPKTIRHLAMSRKTAGGTLTLSL
ncbi:MAG: hypothetical protein P8Y48_09790 [Novosphingobium sp.]